MAKVDAAAGTDQVLAEPGSDLSRAHRTVCTARSTRQHARGGDVHRQRAHSSHSRHRVVSARYSSQMGIIEQGAVVQAPPKPRRRSVMTCLAITVTLGLLFVIAVEVFLPTVNTELLWVGLLLILVGGAVCENAIRFDGLRASARYTDPLNFS